MAQPGDVFQCPKCGRAWEHDCDEAEGCAWYEVDYDVTVCAACHTSSCWLAEFMCQSANGADIAKKAASELRARGREHFDYFSLAKLEESCGTRPKLRDATPEAK